MRSALLFSFVCSSGCGTTRWTDTSRTVTEQLLVSDAVDQAIAQVDVSHLEGRPVFLDVSYLDATVVDKGYLISTMRQHLLANGCLLQEDRNKATYVVELRSGGIGTDRHDLLFGVPAMNIPVFLFATPGIPAQTPEIPLAKRTKQIGTAKIAVFAYNRLTGRPLWQSGSAQASSNAKHTWLLGAGPFQQGTIRSGTNYAGEPIRIPLITTEDTADAADDSRTVHVTQEATWKEQSPHKEGDASSTATALDPVIVPLSGEEPVDIGVPPPTGSGPAQENPPAAADSKSKAQP